MFNPGIQAERNLVINGKFTKWLTDWNKGPVNPSYVVTKGEIYNGLPINILSALDGSSVFQDIAVPKRASAEVRYDITFLCEMDHDKEGLLELSIVGGTETQKIRLEVGGRRDRNADRLREENGQPLEFKPRSYSVPVTLPLLDTHVLRVTVTSPPNAAGDYFSALRMTDIDIQLHLPAAQLQALQLDKQVLPLNRALPLCLGAFGESEHLFKCVHAQDDAWQNTRVSLNSEDNPQGAIEVDPDWGKDKPLNDTWSLSCPDIDGELPHLFNLRVLNEFNAPVLEIPVSLDHHRVKILESREAAYYVVLEYGQSTRVGVRIGSHYTDKALSGRTVTWKVEGTTVKSLTPTDHEGWSWFEYKPLAAGDLRIEASIESLYYASGVVAETFEVTVLETDPLKDVRTIVAEEQKQPWEQQGYPNRGTIYGLLIEFPEVLHNTEVTLHWAGDAPEQLGVTVTPLLETAVPVGPEGMVEFQFDNKDQRDGDFSLTLSSSRLSKRSLAKPMSLARNVVKPGDVREPDRTCVVDENESARMWVQVLHDTTFGNGDPVEGALVFWQAPDVNITRTFTGADGWSSFSYQPLSAGDHPVKATIKAHEEAQPSEKNFVVKAIETSLWKQHVQIFLDETPVDLQTLGLICYHGQTHTLRIEPVSGSPWIDTKSITLDWREKDPQIGLKPANLGKDLLLPAEGLTWSLSSSATDNISGLFELRLKADGVSDDRELSGRFINPDLKQEMSLRLDRVSAVLDGHQLFPCLGADHTFTVWPNALSPLVGLSIELQWSGTSADDLGATVRPPWRESQTLGADGASWELDFTGSPIAGHFALALNLPLLDFDATVTATPMVLGDNALRFNYLLESPVDPVVGIDKAWTWVNVVSRFTHKPVADVPVTWSAGGDPVEVNTDIEGNSGFGLLPTSADTHVVQSWLWSPYDNFTEEKNVTIRPLPEDPWSQVTMSIDGQPGQVLGSITGFPRRNGVHSMVTFFPQELEGQVVRLGQTGTAPSVLGNRYEPELGVAQVVTGGLARFALRAGDLKDGSFALRLSAERLARLSPANAMSQGSSLQVVEFGESVGAGRVLDWGEALEWQVELKSSISAKAIPGMTVAWHGDGVDGLTCVSDFYGRAKVRSIPTRPGLNDWTATVGAGESARSIHYQFRLNEPRKVSELTPLQPGSDTGAQVEFQARVVSALDDQPLGDVEVMWNYADKFLPSTLTNAEGEATVRFTLGAPGVAALCASVKGGLAGWDVRTLIVNIVESRYAAVESVVAIPNPVPVNQLVEMTAQIVDKQSRKPMPFRKILVSRNNAPLIEGLTDSEGKYTSMGRPVQVPQVMSMTVKVENPDGSSDTGSVQVEVVN
ncbi:Ig-like domain-containing protein [Pseudomonas neuropathica]|uniref:Ig-like domain-containing protein n=1 Tax=Pseudomonas neuropathica TaxID=2730425 RepID=UPI003EBF5308